MSKGQQTCGCDLSVNFLCSKHASAKSEYQESRLLNDVIGCTLKIIRGGLTGDKALVAAYADLMADKLEDANHPLTRHVRAHARANFGQVVKTVYSHTGIERDPLTDDLCNDPEGD